MTLQQLKYALMIAKNGSINRAAEELFIAQSSLSCALKDLETELQITIFQRTGRGVTPTPDGAEFLSQADKVYREYALLQEKYLSADRVKRKFGVSTQHYSFVVKAFAETVKKYDTLNFEFALRETKTLEVISDVTHMKSEVGIIFKSAYNEKIIEKTLAENGLEFLPLVRCRAYVYLWKGHPLAEKSELTLGQLSEYPRLSFEQGDMAAAFFAEEILEELDYPRVIKTLDRATQLNLMKALGGYTLCSGIICEELNGGDFTAIPFRSDNDEEMEIGCVTKRQARLSDIAETFIAEVKKYLANN